MKHRRTLIAKNKITGKELVVETNIDNNEDKKIFGDCYLSDGEKEYIEDEIGQGFELEIVEDY
jgi:hypothetical protein